MRRPCGKTGNVPTFWEGASGRRFAWGHSGVAPDLRFSLHETGLPGGWGDIVVTTGILTFAFSTILGWSFYGETGASYLFGAKVIKPYRIVWLVFVYLGAAGSLQIVWSIADTLNGMMAIPNLIAILGSSGVVIKALKDFERKRREAALGEAEVALEGPSSGRGGRR